MGTLVTVDGTTCYGFTCYIGNTCARTTWTLEPLVTGLVEPLGPLMQGLLETPGLTVAGHLVHGQVKVVPYFVDNKFMYAGYNDTTEPCTQTVKHSIYPQTNGQISFPAPWLNIIVSRHIKTRGHRFGVAGLASKSLAD